MNEKSKLLKIVFDRYGGEDRNPSSINRLFTEILRLLLPNAEIPELSTENAVEVSEEIKEVRNFFKEKKIDAAAALNVMEAGVDIDGLAIFFDSIIFSNIMAELGFISSRSRGKVVTCDDVCNHILISPTKLIISALQDFYNRQSNAVSSVPTEEDDGDDG